MTRKPVGIRDVAEAAGVSATTVSHILNDVPHARVNPDTRQRVQDAAVRLGYAPNRMARALRTHRSGLIGLVSDEIVTSPHAGKIILGAQHAAAEHDYTLVLVNVSTRLGGGTPDREVRTLLQQEVDGVIYATMFHREIALPSLLRGVPTVLLDATSPGAGVPAVVPDEVGGARAAVQELLDHGHRRIAFTTNVEDVPATRGRLQGYRAALAASGVEFDPGLVSADESEVPGGYRTARELLGRDPRPDALFCYNDRMAMGAYRAAAELGLRIPDDVSVVGFDNQELIAENLYPGLTTVALPHYDMGCWAVARLLHMVTAEDAAPAREPVLLPCPLVRRESVAPRS